MFSGLFFSVLLDFFCGYLLSATIIGLCVCNLWWHECSIRLSVRDVRRPRWEVLHIYLEVWVLLLCCWWCFYYCFSLDFFAIRVPDSRHIYIRLLDRLLLFSWCDTLLVFCCPRAFLDLPHSLCQRTSRTVRRQPIYLPSRPSPINPVLKPLNPLRGVLYTIALFDTFFFLNDKRGP